MALVTPEVGGGDPSGRRQGRHAFITFGYQPKASRKDTGSPPWACTRTVSQNGTVDRPSRHSHKCASTQYVFMKHVSEMDLGSARPAKSYETVQPAIKQMLLRESLSATCATNASGTLEQRRGLRVFCVGNSCFLRRWLVLVFFATVPVGGVFCNGGGCFLRRSWWEGMFFATAGHVFCIGRVCFLRRWCFLRR